MLDGAPRSASAIALEATEALTLPRDQFRALANTEPAIRDALLASLARELRRLTTHVAELHFLDLTGRLAARLARLAEEHGERLPDGSIRLDAPLTQSDLAAMIGATRQSVNKLLGEFEEDGPAAARARQHRRPRPAGAGQGGSPLGRCAAVLSPRR